MKIIIFKLFVEVGLDPRALLIHNLDNENYSEFISFVIEKDIKISEFQIVMALFSSEENVDSLNELLHILVFLLILN